MNSWLPLNKSLIYGRHAYEPELAVCKRYTHQSKDTQPHIAASAAPLKYGTPADLLRDLHADQ